MAIDPKNYTFPLEKARDYVSENGLEHFFDLGDKVELPPKWVTLQGFIS